MYFILGTIGAFGLYLGVLSMLLVLLCTTLYIRKSRLTGSFSDAFKNTTIGILIYLATLGLSQVIYHWVLQNLA